MSKQNVSQDLFLRVKERLDYHRLPAQFPLEAAPLINKLLSKIDGNNENRQTNQTITIQGQVDNALRFEIARVVRQNNELHLDIINLKEQVQSLEHRLYKHDSNKHSNKTQFEQYQQMRNKREEQLINELREIRYKYNELMDFLHEDPNQEREYIKRLMKHKHTKVQQHHDNKQPKQNLSRNEEATNHKIAQLEQRIFNRDQQIARLHKHLQYDGVNLNKLVNNFNKHLFKQQLNGADHKIQYLENSYDRIKKENSKMKSNNGSKEALRAEVENCHLIIQKLKQENNQLKRNSKEQVFNLQRRTSENDRTVQKIKNEKANSDNTNAQNELTIKDLGKKIEFLQKQLDEARKISQIVEEKAAGLEADKNNLLKKLEETKVFFEYQLQNAKKRAIELEFELQQSHLKNQQMGKELDLILRESQLKSESIINLEKIVSELISKNSLVAAEERIKQYQDLELRRRVIEMEQKLIISQDQKALLQARLRIIQQALKQKHSREYAN